MSGHHAGHTPRNAPAAAGHRLDQFAAAVAEARSTNPALAALAPTEAQFIDAAMDIGAHLDRPTVGAAWLILGQLFGTNLASTPPEQQAGALAMLLNVARLAGQRLYEGDRLPVEIRCPFTFATGAPCTKVVKGCDEKQFDTYMRAHIWQAHPGETWAPREAEGPAPRAQQYPVGGALPIPDEDPYPLSVLGENPTFAQLQRFACVRVMAMTSLGVDREVGDPVTGRKGDLTPQAAWERAERDYELILAPRERQRTADADDAPIRLVTGTWGTAYCACGHLAEVIVGTTNRPEGEPGEAKAQCLDCARRAATASPEPPGPCAEPPVPGEYDLTVDEALEALRTGRPPSEGERTGPGMCARCGKVRATYHHAMHGDLCAGCYDEAQG